MKKFSNLPDYGNEAKYHEDGARNTSKQSESKGKNKGTLPDYYSTLESAQTLKKDNSKTFGFGQKLQPTT